MHRETGNEIQDCCKTEAKAKNDISVVFAEYLCNATFPEQLVRLIVMVGC